MNASQLRLPPSDLRGSRPVASCAPLYVRCSATAAEIEAALQKEPLKRLFIPYSVWSASSLLLFYSFTKCAWYDALLHNAHSGRRSSLCALRRLEDILAWFRTEALITTENEAKARLDTLVSFGRKRACFRSTQRKTPAAKARAASFLQYNGGSYKRKRSTCIADVGTCTSSSAPLDVGGDVAANCTSYDPSRDDRRLPLHSDSLDNRFESCLV